jgi:hypothetical protein
MIVLLIVLAIVCFIGAGFVWGFVFRAVVDNWRPW